MPDWTKSMQQSYEYYIVEPTTLADVKRLDNVKSATFNRDSDYETLGSATINVTDTIGENYVRCYLKTVQNGITEKHPLGTVLVQSPSSTFNGKIMSSAMDAYTPLIELKENQPPLGYTIRKGTRIMDAAYTIVREHARVPVNEVEPTYELVNGELVDVSPKLEGDFTANTDDTWLSFLIDLIAIARYELGLDELGRILFMPIQDIASLQPVWAYDDNDKSILYQDVTIDRDLYKIPNVVEVVYSYGSICKRVVVKNEDPNSPTSIINRGREIGYRDLEPSLTGYVTDAQIQDYAERLLSALSTIKCTVRYTHAYCPVRVGDCVRLNYTKAGINNVKAKVISQSIKTELGCSVSEVAVFTTKLWR